MATRSKSNFLRLVHITTVPQSLNFLRGQVRFMVERGINVSAISSPGPALNEFELQEGITAYPVRMARRITPVADLKAVVGIVRVLRRIGPDVVHAHTPKGGLLGMISATIFGVPIRIYHVHGLPYLTAKGFKRTLLRSTEWISCRLAHRVIFVSHSIRDAAIADRICAPSKATVIRGGSVNGVDTDDRFNPSSYSSEFVAQVKATWGIPVDAMVILFVGRVVRDKGVEELSKAWQTIQIRFPETWLVLVGPEESEDPISARSSQILQSSRRTVMTGRVSDPAIFYAMADVVVLPSHREGFGNVNIEAASMGRPVVSTLIPGCMDSVKDGETGTLVPPRDAQALEDAITKYLELPGLRAEHGKAGRNRVVRDFKQEGIWEGVFQEYCQLLESKGLPIPTPLAT